METLLITTDLSENSKAAVQFALQLAAQGGYKLVFLHVTELLKPVKWSEEFYKNFEQQELDGLKRQLMAFVMEVSAGTGSTVINPEYVVHNSSSVAANVVHYATQHQISYICLSRKGGGNSLKLFGSITATLLEKSSVPVIAVPEDYVSGAVETICYASDLEHIAAELQQVGHLADTLKARVSLLHFSSPVTGEDAVNKIAVAKEQLSSVPVDVHVEPMDFEVALSDRLARSVENLKPDLLVMFTRQNRSFFERIFLSSISAEFAAEARLPLLVFRKQQ
ncbi:universal stress protein [Pedobacter quisquiliarum]|nr:universal stress protein [Pedobacter quisquiliarum]